VIAFIQTPQMMAKRMEEAKAKGEKLGKRAAGGSGLFYLDGNLRRVKMDAPVVNNACDQKASGGRQPGGSGEGRTRVRCWRASRREPVIRLILLVLRKRLPAGSTLMFQMHYSAFRGSLKEAVTDRTTIGLIFAKQPPDKMVITSAAANVMFKIPAGDGNHEVVACQTVPRDIQVINYMPHMHLRGKDMKYEAIYPDRKRETLLWVPKFSFNWQSVYWLKHPVNIPKGTKLIVTAHFDNSTKNKYNPDPEEGCQVGRSDIR